MFTPRKTNVKQHLRYVKARKIWQEKRNKGSETYLDFRKVVNMHLNLVMPAISILHRDHKIPASFCRKLGLTPEQTNHVKNMEYLNPKKNVDKFSFLYEKERDHLKVMCEIWGIEYPDHTMIDQHNADSLVKGTSLDQGKGKNIKKSYKKFGG